MDLIDRADVHDLIAKRLSDYLTDESREELEELDIKVEEDIPTVQAVPIEAVLDILEKEGHKWGNDYRDWVDAIEEIKNLPSVNPQESSITWVTGSDGAKIAFKDVPAWKVIKICQILDDTQESEEV